jgi:hypothetical protein
MKRLFFFLILFSVAGSCAANNVVLSNISIVNNGGGNVTVQFDLSWENSWRVPNGPSNYDGVWVFFRFRNDGGEWWPMYMNGTNNVLPSGFEVYQTSDELKVGAMIHRSVSNIGQGNVSLSAVRLGISGVPYSVDIRGFAMEMVYIPTITNFYLGDEDGISGSDNALHDANGRAALVGSRFFSTSGDDFASSGLQINAAGIEGNADFVTGQAFWCMKYEISQAGYRDFLNTLTVTQQTHRTAHPPLAEGIPALDADRSYIKVKVPAGNTPAIFGCDADNNGIMNEDFDGEWVVCGGLMYQDLAAFLDWSGLAPMNEVMFERVCRGATDGGPNPAVAGEYAWGSAVLNFFIGGSSPNSGADEYFPLYDAGGGNAAMSFPLRVGSYATANSDRVSSGAGFYGVLDLSGNCFEIVVTLSTPAGRSFTNINGDGRLDDNGFAYAGTMAWSWPSNMDVGHTATCMGCSVLDAGGTGLRGGACNFPTSLMHTSDRTYSNGNFNFRHASFAGRGVLYIR